jgi:hypothetical protein
LLRVDRSALGWTAGVYGIYAGILGVEHGFFEALQGNTATAHLRVFAASWTLIPNFLATGIAAMLCSVAMIVWSTRFIRGKRGGVVLALLSVVLLLVGGGFGPISLLIVACIAASRMGKPLRMSRALIPPVLCHALARLWLWLIAASLVWVPAEFAAGQVFHLQNDHRQILTNLNLLLTYPMLGLFVLALASAIARVIEGQNSGKVSSETT